MSVSLHDRSYTIVFTVPDLPDSSGEVRYPRAGSTSEDSNVKSVESQRIADSSLPGVRQVGPDAIGRCRCRPCATRGIVTLSVMGDTRPGWRLPTMPAVGDMPNRLVGMIRGVLVQA